MVKQRLSLFRLPILIFSQNRPVSLTPCKEDWRMFKMGGCYLMMIWTKSYEALLDRNGQTGSASYSAIYCRRKSSCGQKVGRPLKRACTEYAPFAACRPQSAGIFARRYP